MKPAKCIHCPLYSNRLMPSIGETLNAEVVFLLDSPPSFAKTPLSGNEGVVLKEVLGIASKEDMTGNTTRLINRAMYMYSVTCASELESKVKLIDRCRDSVGAQQLLNSGARVVVAFGAKPLSFFGIKSQHKEARGGVLDVNFLGRDIKVVVTFALSGVIKKPGLTNLVANDIRKATKLVKGESLDSMDVPALLAGYEIPSTLEEAIDIANRYSTYSKPGKDMSSCMMALDYETNTLFPHYEGSRAIAISGAVEPGRAFALYIDHKDSPYDFTQIIPYIWKILQSPHPKTWWNYKFDYGVTKYTLIRQTKEAMDKYPWRKIRERIEEVVGKSLEEIFSNPVNNTRWDGMLAEHMLDENKAGHYSLKQVVLNHFPSLAGYEKPLHVQLKDGDSTKTQAKVSRACSLQDGLVENNSPVGYTGDLLGEIDTLKSLSSKLKKMSKKKSTPEEVRATAEDTVVILNNRAKYVKKVAKAVTSLIKTSDKVQFEIKYKNPLRAGTTFEEVTTDVMMPYAAIDADLTLRISTKQRKAAWLEDPKSTADEEGRGYMMSLMDKHYLPLTEILCDMQNEGIRMDREYLLEEYSRQSSREVELELDLVEKIAKDLGREEGSIILHNPAEVANIMVAGYGLPKVKYTDSGETSSDSEALGIWGQTQPIALEILEYRNTTKAKSTYLENLITLSDYDGFIRGSLWLNGTATGRLSSSDPNLQNQPPEVAGTHIKKAFTTTDTSEGRSGWDSYLMDKYGWVVNEELCVVDLDYAGAEVRGLTVYAQDPALLQALNDGLDMHSWVASIVFDLEYDAIDKARKIDSVKRNKEEEFLVTKRKHAKAVVFGLLFCISAPKLATQLGIHVREAESLMRMFFKRFPRINDYITYTKSLVLHKGVLRTPTGRARRFPLAKMGGSIGSACGRQGVNYLVQGFTSEIVTRTLIELSKHIGKIKGRLMITVHDSIVFEMPRSLLPSLDGFFKMHVRDFIQREFPMVPVELPYDIEVGPTYGEAKYSVEAYTQK
jgi:DNA polymerase I-like protein with 3'-5' exonuclease and polymerase domains